MAKRKRTKREEKQRRKKILTGAGIAVVLVILVVLVYINMSNQETTVLGPDPSINRGVTGDSFHYVGSLDAPVTMVMYEDYGCPNCKIFKDAYEVELLNSYVADGKVRLEVHPIAIVNIRSLPSAEALLCAAEQGYFWEYRHLLFLNQGSRMQDRELFEGIAEVLEIDRSDFLSCLDEGRYREEIIELSQAAQEFGVQGTPTFEIVGERYPRPGEVTLPDIFEVLDQALEGLN